MKAELKKIMAQEETRNTSAGTYPFVPGTNYTDTENQEYIKSPLSDPDIENDTEEDVTDEVKAARAQVENTRAEMTDTIDALKEKLSPSNLVAEAKEATIGVAQAAVGDALDSAKAAAHNVIDTAKEVAANAADAVQGVALNVAASVSNAFDTAKTAVSHTVHDAEDAAKTATLNVREVSHSVGTAAKGAGATIVETIRLNPIPAAITGIGLGWLLMSIRRQNDTAARAYPSPSPADRFVTGTDEFGQNNFATASPSGIDAAKEKLGDVKDAVTQHATDLAATVSNKASGIAHTAGDKASDIAHTVSDKASALGTQAKDTAQSAVSATGTYINDNPLAAGAIALLVGVSIGLMVPVTEKENQLLGETRDKLKDQAAEQFHQVADKVTSVAQTAFDSAKQTVKDEVQNQGLTAASA